MNQEVFESQAGLRESELLGPPGDVCLGEVFFDPIVVVPADEEVAENLVVFEPPIGDQFLHDSHVVAEETESVVVVEPDPLEQWLTLSNEGSHLFDGVLDVDDERFEIWAYK
jgi:hypothetical protein